MILKRLTRRQVEYCEKTKSGWLSEENADSFMFAPGKEFKFRQFASLERVFLSGLHKNDVCRSRPVPVVISRQA